MFVCSLLPPMIISVRLVCMLYGQPLSIIYLCLLLWFPLWVSFAVLQLQNIDNEHRKGSVILSSALICLFNVLFVFILTDTNASKEAREIIFQIAYDSSIINYGKDHFLNRLFNHTKFADDIHKGLNCCGIYYPDELEQYRFIPFFTKSDMFVQEDHWDPGGGKMVLPPTCCKPSQGLACTLRTKAQACNLAFESKIKAAISKYDKITAYMLLTIGFMGQIYLMSFV